MRAKTVLSSVVLLACALCALLLVLHSRAEDTPPPSLTLLPGIARSTLLWQHERPFLGDHHRFLDPLGGPIERVGWTTGGQ